MAKVQPPEFSRVTLECRESSLQLAVLGRVALSVEHSFISCLVRGLTFLIPNTQLLKSV